MTLRDIERVLYFEAYVVVDPGMTPLSAASCSIRRGRISRPSAASTATSSMRAMGAEGVRELLAEIDLDVEIETLRDDDRDRLRDQDQEDSPSA